MESRGEKENVKLLVTDMIKKLMASREVTNGKNRYSK